MSDINVGDLVMVVKPRPCGHAKLGAVFIVQGIEFNRIYCVDCGWQSRSPTKNAILPDGTVSALYRLKKIDPPAESARIERDEEITA